MPGHTTGLRRDLGSRTGTRNQLWTAGLAQPFAFSRNRDKQRNNDDNFQRHFIPDISKIRDLDVNEK